MTDIECYLGDVISFGEHNAAFVFMPTLFAECQQSALANAVHYAQNHVSSDTVPRASSIVAAQVRVLSREQKLAQARTLLATHLVYQEAFNEEGWGQVSSNMPATPMSSLQVIIDVIIAHQKVFSLFWKSQYHQLSIHVDCS